MSLTLHNVMIPVPRTNGTSETIPAAAYGSLVIHKMITGTGFALSLSPEVNGERQPALMIMGGVSQKAAQAMLEDVVVTEPEFAHVKTVAEAQRFGPQIVALRQKYKKPLTRDQRYTVMSWLKAEGLDHLGDRYGKAGEFYGVRGGSRAVAVGQRDVLLNQYIVEGRDERWVMKDAELISKMTPEKIRTWAAWVKQGVPMRALRTADLDRDLQALVARNKKNVSVDPTKDMSPEDAAKWKAMNEEHGDKFKKAMHDLAALDLELTAASLPGAGLDKDAAALEEMSKLADLERSADQMVGRTILEQMGGARRLQVMLGVQQVILLNDGVGIKWPNKQPSKGNYVEIKLNGSDLYDVSFFMVGRGAKKLVKKYDDVYAEDLVDIFEKQTGWYLRMASEQAHVLVRAAGTRGPDPKGRDWKKMENPTRWNWFNREANVNFTVNEKMGPGMPLYTLMVLTDHGMFKHVKPFQWKTPEEAFKAAAMEFPKLAGEMALNDLTEHWSKVGSAMKMWDGHFFTPDQAKTFGDRRFNYVAFKDLSHSAQSTARRMYPHKSVGAMYDFIDEHYLYPVDKSGNLGKAQRVLAIPLKQIQDADYMKSLGYTMNPGWPKAAADGDEKEGMFEKDVPADPTENMSPEDAAEWRKNTEEHKDKFKAACDLMAEGCPDNLDESGCAEWEANTEKYRDVVKDRQAMDDNPWSIYETEGYEVATLEITKAVEKAKEFLSKVYKGGDPFNQALKMMRPVLAKWRVFGTDDSEVYYSVEAALRRHLKSLGIEPTPRYASRKTASANYYVSLAPDGAVKVDGIVDNILFNLIYARVMGLRYNQIQPVNLKVMSVRGRRTTYREALEEMVQFNSGTQMYDIAVIRPGTYLVRNVDIAKSLLDNATDEEEDAANLRDFGGQVRSAYEEGSRVPDGWDNGHVEGKEKTDKPGEEGSDTPDGEGNQTKRAGEVIEEMYALVSEDGYMLGATDDWSDARSKSFWRYSVDDDHIAEGKLMTLVNVPLPMAEKFKDMGTHAQMFNDGYDAWAAARRFAKGSGVRLAAEKEAATGLYGHPKRVQADCESCIRRVQKTATQIARNVYARHEGVAEFLATHARRADSLPAQLLVAALREAGPKVARQVRLAELRLDSLASKTPAHKAVWAALSTQPKVALNKVQSKEAFADLLSATQDMVTMGLVAFDGVTVAKVTDADAQTGEDIKQTTDKTARTYGLYGFGEKVAKLGLQACSDLRHEAGKIAHDLHRRRADRHAAITDFFANHSKQAKCSYSRLLAASYPELKTASALNAPRTVQAWLEWVE